MPRKSTWSTTTPACPPSQIEGIITNVYEQNFQYVDGLKGIESKSIQNFVQLKLTFYPGTDMAAAMSQVVSLTNRARGQMPPSVLPPFVIRFDAANVPIGYLVMESKSRPMGELADLGLFRIRPLLISQVPGTVSFSPFGSNTRAIVITVDPDRLRAHNFTPEDVVGALETGNVVVPSGNLYAQGQMPLVPTNAMVADPQELGNIPVKLGMDVYIRDVGTIHDSTDINYGCALVNGHRSVYIPVVKKDTASTLTVVEQIHDSLPLFQVGGARRTWTCATSSTNRPRCGRPSRASATEGLIGAALTGLMILLFLHDLRSVVVVLVSIPLSLTTSLVGLWLTGNTINIMSLGGLALAIGILVDEATVTIENTHAQMRRTPSISRAARRAARPRPRPASWPCSAFCRCSSPPSSCNEPVRSLFMPLTLAVGFAMIASYLLSSTLVPVLSRLAHAARAARRFTSKGFSTACCRTSRGSWRSRCGTVGSWFPLTWSVAACCSGSSAGRWAPNCFPEVDSGQFVLRFRAPPGSEYELTRKCAVEDSGGHQRAKRGQGGHLDGLRGHGRHEHRHQQHAAVHARPPTTACCGCGCKRRAACAWPSSANGCARRCRSRWCPG